MVLILFVIGLLVFLVFSFVRMPEFLENEDVFLCILGIVGIILGIVSVGFCVVCVFF